jgi:hypothetical protein
MVHLHRFPPLIISLQVFYESSILTAYAGLGNFSHILSHVLRSLRHNPLSNTAKMSSDQVTKFLGHASLKGIHPRSIRRAPNPCPIRENPRSNRNNSIGSREPYRQPGLRNSRASRQDYRSKRTHRYDFHQATTICSQTLFDKFFFGLLAVISAPYAFWRFVCITSCHYEGTISFVIVDK